MGLANLVHNPIAEATAGGEEGDLVVGMGMGIKGDIFNLAGLPMIICSPPFSLLNYCRTLGSGQTVMISGQMWVKKDISVGMIF